MTYQQCFLTILITTTLVSCQLYIATFQLKPLLKTEASIVEYLEQYMIIARIHFQKHVLEQKMFLLQEHINNFKKHDYYSLQDPDRYVENPLNAYLLIKRLTIDLKNIRKLLETDEPQFFSKDKDLKLPNEEDIMGASISIARLQDVYDLKTPDLARGQLYGVKEAPEFTASDCFELGRKLFEAKDFHYAFLWMREALGRLKNNNENKDNLGDEPDAKVEPEYDHTELSLISILEYMGLSSFNLGNEVLAADLSKNLTRLLPSYRSPLEDLVENIISSNNSLRGRNTLSFIDKLTYRDSYEELNSLCRGHVDIRKQEETNRTLKCYYSDNGVSYYKIGPFKIEEIHGDPVEVLLFHDILGEYTMESLKELSQPKLHKNNKIDATTQYRISKSSFFELTHPAFKKVNQAIEDLSGLNQLAYESLHVANYGLGGQFLHHYDFGGNSDSLGMGRRIATVLFYLSEVTQGGATIFLYLNTVIWPKKGSAVFWYNLLHSGEGNKLTMHAACPVIQGSKWIANQWIHEHHQEFRRPCSLERPPASLVYLPTHTANEPDEHYDY